MARVVTPGTVLDENALSSKDNNYIISLVFHPNNMGLAVADLSTGELYAGEFTSGDIVQVLLDQLTHFHPRECILSKSNYDQPDLMKLLVAYPQLTVYCFAEWDEYSTQASKYVKDFYNLLSLSGGVYSEDGNLLSVNFF